MLNTQYYRRPNHTGLNCTDLGQGQHSKRNILTSKRHERVLTRKWRGTEFGPISYPTIPDQEGTVR